MNKKGSFLGGFFLFILIVVIIFELALMFIAWHYADKVKCNLIWCEFTFKDVNVTSDYIVNIINHTMDETNASFYLVAPDDVSPSRYVCYGDTIEGYECYPQQKVNFINNTNGKTK